MAKAILTAQIVVIVVGEENLNFMDILLEIV